MDCTTKLGSMSLELLHLRKLIKLCYLTPNRQVSEVRADIRHEIARERGELEGGGDFHSPFWRDAREHAFHREDLHDSVESRVEANNARLRLYPRLRDGFLRWWNERRRWTNEPFLQIDSPHTRFNFDNMGVIKVEGLLAIRDAGGASHYVYPYFAEAPTLSEEAGRVMLWVIFEALPNLDRDAVVVLDVLRGQPFTADRFPLQGNEEDILRQRYRYLLNLRDQLLPEYGI